MGTLIPRADPGDEVGRVVLYGCPWRCTGRTLRYATPSSLSRPGLLLLKLDLKTPGRGFGLQSASRQRLITSEGVALLLQARPPFISLAASQVEIESDPARTRETVRRGESCRRHV